MRETLKQWWLPCVMLLAANLLSIKLGYDQVNGNAKAGLNLNSSLEDWRLASYGSDSGFYLEVAQNIAAGKGAIQQVPGSNPPTYCPFTYWGPGAPFIFGGWLWLTGGTTVWSMFVFSAIAQLLAGFVTLATVALYTRRIGALVATAFFAGFCPATHVVFYSWMITCSEIAVWVPAAFGIYALSKAFLLKATPGASLRAVCLWFVIAGLCLGFASIAREVLTAFASFVILFLIAQTRFKSRNAFRKALIYSGVLYLALNAARCPVQIWNYYRIDQPVVTTTNSTHLILRNEWWQAHATPEFAANWGVGFGEYLDPSAPARVEPKYARASRFANVYSIWELTCAICRHPYQALTFKLARWPILWLDTNCWPDVHLTFVSYWCIGMYTIFFFYIGLELWKRRPVPETVYLFAAFTFAMSFLAHSEYRYSISCWHTFVLVPGLLWESIRSRQAARTLQTPLQNIDTTQLTERLKAAA